MFKVKVESTLFIGVKSEEEVRKMLGMMGLTEVGQQISDGLVAGNNLTIIACEEIPMESLYDELTAVDEEQTSFDEFHGWQAQPVNEFSPTMR